MALKDAEVRALKALDRVYKRADERGLYVEVHPSGSKLWRLKYRRLGRDICQLIKKYGFAESLGYFLQN